MHMNMDTSLVVEGDAKSKNLPPLPRLSWHLLLCYLRLEVRPDPAAENMTALVSAYKSIKYTCKGRQHIIKGTVKTYHA